VQLRSGSRPVPGLDTPLEEVWVSMDPDRMTSVIGNLIQNAQDATPDEGMVSVSLGQEGGRAVIVIEDNGCGMDAAFVRERLFRPFDTTKGDTGMGIGAYECREYVQGLGGELKVESETGAGTRMQITLPLVAENVAAQANHRPKEPLVE